MKPVFTILKKVLVREFYVTNASFFLVVIGLGAGFMRSYEHIALAEFLISSPILLLIPILVWSLYTLKVVKFNLDTLRRNENEFLYAFSLFPPRKQWLALVGALALQLIPVLMYAIFLVLMAAKNNLVLTLLLILLTCLLLTFLSSLSLIRALHHPHVEKNAWAITSFINSITTKPYPLFFPEWIVRRQAVVVMGTKFFSGLILFGVAQLYKTDQYDLRLFAMAVVVAYASNVNLVWEMHRFDNAHLSIVRNMPISLLKRLGYFLFTLSILTFPEAVIILKNFPQQFNLIDQASVIFFGLSITLLFYGCLYYKDWGQERLITIVFFTGIALIILILFKAPLFVLGTVNLCIGIIIWTRYYYSFEYISKS